MSSNRNYTSATTYENTPQQVRNRELRNKARLEMERRLGHKLPTNVDVDHKKPLALGGQNTTGNLRAISEHRNTAWRRGQTGYKVKAV